MRALKELWTPTSRLYSRADEGQPRRFVLDCGIAWQNWLDDAGVFQEIDLSPEVIAGGLRVRKVPYDLTLLTTGERRVAPDRAFAATRFIRFPANKFLANKTFTRVGNSLVWQSNAYNIVLRWENSRVKFDVVLKRSVPFDSVSFDVDKAGLDDTTLLSYLANLKAIDSSPEPIMRPLSVSLVAGVLTLGFDLTGMTFPVTIDPTLDLQVGASADDVLRRLADGTTKAFWTDQYGIFGEHFSTGVQYEYEAASRYLNATIPNAATISVAYETLQAQTSYSAVTVNAIIKCENADNAAQITSYDDYTNRTKTTGAAWNDVAAWTANADYNTPSIVTDVQTVVNRAGWVSGNALQCFEMDNGSTTGISLVVRDWKHYDQSTTAAPKLHIEYTAGGAAFVPRLMVI